MHGGGLALPAICPVALLCAPLHDPIAHGRGQSGTRGTMGALPAPDVAGSGPCRVPIASLLRRADGAEAVSAQADSRRGWVGASDSAHHPRQRLLFRTVSAAPWVCLWVRGARLRQPNVLFRPWHHPRRAHLPAWCAWRSQRRPRGERDVPLEGGVGEQGGRAPPICGALPAPPTTHGRHPHAGRSGRPAINGARRAQVWPLVGRPGREARRSGERGGRPPRPCTPPPPIDAAAATRAPPGVPHPHAPPPSIPPPHPSPIVPPRRVWRRRRPRAPRAAGMAAAASSPRLSAAWGWVGGG